MSNIIRADWRDSRLFDSNGILRRDSDGARHFLHAAAKKKRAGASGATTPTPPTGDEPVFDPEVDTLILQGDSSDPHYDSVGDMDTFPDTLPHNPLYLPGSSGIVTSGGTTTTPQVSLVTGFDVSGTPRGKALKLTYPFCTMAITQTAPHPGNSAWTDLTVDNDSSIYEVGQAVSISEIVSQTQLNGNSNHTVMEVSAGIVTVAETTTGTHAENAILSRQQGDSMHPFYTPAQGWPPIKTQRFTAIMRITGDVDVELIQIKFMRFVLTGPGGGGMPQSSLVQQPGGGFGYDFPTDSDKGMWLWLGQGSTGEAQQFTPGLGVQAQAPWPKAFVSTSPTPFRVTYEFRPHSTPGTWDGFKRMWVDGVKIMDVSSDGVDYTPPGGFKPYCTQEELENTIICVTTDGVNPGPYCPGVEANDAGGPSFMGLQTNGQLTEYTAELDLDSLIWWRET